MKPSVIALFLLICCAFTGTDRPLTIEQILANPEQYNGKTVHVTGYFTQELEKRAIYQSKNDAKISNYKASLWLADYTNLIQFLTKWGNTADEPFLANKYVVVTGKLNYKPDTINGKVYGHGPENLWPAELVEISHIQEAK
ncbi:MAG TPA: hypothetical protein VI731_12575 [Bacteroidia bacterium]|nr:hypothetical protein [Bacteroidia bacterium]